MDDGAPSGKPVYINLFFHFEDHINRSLSQPAIRRLVEIVIRKGVRCDFYYTALLLDFLARESPETLTFLRSLHQQHAHGLGYHGEIHGPNPTHWVSLNQGRMNLDEGIDWCLTRESHWVDPLSGELDLSRVGGLALHDSLIGKRSTIAAATLLGPQFILALRQLGIRMHIGGEWAFKHSDDALAEMFEGSPLVWWMGQLLLADFQFLWMHESAAKLDRLIARLDRRRPNVIAVAMHDCDVYQERLWAIQAYGGDNLGNSSGANPATFEAARLPAEYVRGGKGQEAVYRRVEAFIDRVARLAKADPAVQIVTGDDLYARVDASAPATFTWPEVLSIATKLADRKSWWYPSGVRPPNFLRSEAEHARYMTLGEAFSLLASTLAHHHQTGQLPAQVQNRPLLGPGELEVEVDPIGEAKGEVDGQAIASAAKAIWDGGGGRVPAVIPLDESGLCCNAAEFLFLMASLVEQLAGGADLPHTHVPVLNSHLYTPLAHTILSAGLSGDLRFPFPHAYRPENVTARLSFQQMWALKPARLLG